MPLETSKPFYIQVFSVPELNIFPRRWVFRFYRNIVRVLFANLMKRSSVLIFQFAENQSRMFSNPLQELKSKATKKTEFSLHKIKFAENSSTKQAAK